MESFFSLSGKTAPPVGTIAMSYTFPVVTLPSGLTVGNFSSPHSFTFVDGTVLPGCDEDRSRALMLRAVEVETPGPKGTTDIALSFEMSDEVRDAVRAVQYADVDVVIVPLPVMQAVKAEGLPIRNLRTCRVADRVAKTVHGDKFCI